MTRYKKNIIQMKAKIHNMRLDILEVRAQGINQDISKDAILGYIQDSIKSLKKAIDIIDRGDWE